MSDQPLINPELKGLFKVISSHIRSRLKLLVTLFIVGLIIGFNASKELVEFLLESGLVPDDVDIIILTPVEFMMIQVRAGAWLGSALAIGALIIELAWRSEIARRVPKPGRTVAMSAIMVLLLALAGLWYSWELLTPMLLDYLASDANTAGLSTQWRLSSFVGFILNLCIASAIGFQAPLVTTLALRSGAISRGMLLAYRRHIWFTTFVLSAAFSPPDPLSLFLVAIPIIVLFEAAIVWDGITGGSTDASD